MDFEWDEAKRAANRAKHGVDLVQAARIFRGPTFQAEDLRIDDGEKRFRSIGLVGDDGYVVVWTWRGSVRRLISAWKGGRLDQERFEARDAR